MAGVFPARWAESGRTLLLIYLYSCDSDRSHRARRRWNGPMRLHQALKIQDVVNNEQEKPEKQSPELNFRISGMDVAKQPSVF